MMSLGSGRGAFRFLGIVDLDAMPVTADVGAGVLGSIDVEARLTVVKAAGWSADEKASPRRQAKTTSSWPGVRA